MKAIKINDIKNFMNSILINDTFDFLLANEVSVTTYCDFHIDCHLNSKYYEEDELNELKDTHFVSWNKIKPLCFELIKGKKVPDKFKFSLLLGSGNYEKVVELSGTSLSSDSIDALFMHITYDNGSLTVISATSLSVFTMDKSIEHYWDDYVTKFLTKHFDIEEI
ncbi:MAG: hypothetical protein E7254_04110 [Lachnospiraceae bacterium]|nr:hypothetical protein [Lachnospiraceae bacterium]